MQKNYGNDEEKWILTNLAFIYAHSGNIFEAKNLLKKLEKNYPDQSDVNEQLKIDIKDIENWITLGTFQDISINKSIEINEIPEAATLIQNYPNPFNPITQIKYQIPEDGYVALKVFDILGREVAVLVDEEKIAGTYTVNFDGSYLSSGIYFYSISAGHFKQVKKMLLVK